LDLFDDDDVFNLFFQKQQLFVDDVGPSASGSEGRQSC
jgi:hypothetical protein